MSSIGLDAIDVSASSDSSSLHSSNSEVEVEVTGKEEFLCMTPAALLQLVVEKDQYNIAASNADAGYDLWAFWHDSRLKLPAWYDVAKDAALIQPSSVCFHGAGVFHPSRLHGREAGIVLQRPHCGVSRSQV